MEYGPQHLNKQPGTAPQTRNPMAGEAETTGPDELLVWPTEGVPGSVRDLSPK